MSGLQISDMTDALTVFPDGAFVPLVVESNTGGLVTTVNYRYNAGLYLAKYSALAAATGAALIGTTGPSTVQADLNARPTSTALAAGAGAALIGHTGNITGETLQTQGAIDNQLPLSFERFGGGPSATAAANNAAWLLMMAALDAGTAGEIQLFTGTYSISTALTFPTFARNVTIQGQGPGRSFIRQTNANQNGITFPSGLNLNVMVRDLWLQGAGSNTTYSGTGMGIYQPLGAGTNDSYGLHFENIWVTNFGSHAIALCDPFNTNFDKVHINYCGGDGFIAGGNTICWKDCYVHNLPENNAVAYRPFAGQATLINCNGVDDCDIWLRSGRSTSDSNDLSALLGAAADAYCSVTLISCNIEAWNTIGLWNSNGVLWVDQTSLITSKASAANVVAVSTRSNFGTGYLGTIPQLGAGGSWLNSRAVHSLSTYAPFSVVDGDASQTVLTYYQDVATAGDGTIPVNGTTSVATRTWARVTSNERWTDTAGFMAGAGGTVTQQTNKSTAVELNKTTGEITMNNAALNAGVIVSFTLTNSKIAATDHVLVQHISGGTVGSYTTTAGAGSGSATIYVRNATAGNLSEAIVLKFTVIKAATT